MVAQFSVAIKLPVGCLDFLKEEIHLSGRSVSFAKEAPGLPFEELVKFHATTSEILVMVIVWL